MGLVVLTIDKVLTVDMFLSPVALEVSSVTSCLPPSSVTPKLAVTVLVRSHNNSFTCTKKDGFRFMTPTKL